MGSATTSDSGPIKFIATPVHEMSRTPVSKKIAFFEKVVKKNRRQSVFWRRFLTLSVYNFFTRISVQNFAVQTK